VLPETQCHITPFAPRHTAYNAKRRRKIKLKRKQPKQRKLRWRRWFL